MRNVPLVVEGVAARMNVADGFDAVEAAAEEEEAVAAVGEAVVTYRKTFASFQ